MDKRKISYIAIPILGLIATISNRLYAGYYHGLFLNEIIEKFDITGMTYIFCNIITIINLIIILFDLYLVIRAKKEGYKYIFNKIFAVVYLILVLISILSFIIIRNNEEIIAKRFEDELNSINNTTIYDVYTKFEKIKELQSDKFSSIKMGVANEIELIPNVIERYLSLFIDSNKWPLERTVYYSVFSRFIILDIILCAVFTYHIRDEYLEEKTNF